MFNKRSFHRLLMLSVALSLLVASCGTPATQGTQPASQPTSGPAATEAPAAGEPVTIEWWTVPSEEYSEEAQREMAEAFEASHPNIKVNVTVLPGPETVPPDAPLVPVTEIGSPLASVSFISRA